MIQKLFSKLLLVLITTLVMNIPAGAQERIIENGNERNPGYWVNLGAGGCYFGPGVMAGLSYSYKGNIFTAKYLKSDEFNFDPGGKDVTYGAPLSIKEIGILYGRSDRTGLIVLTLSGGISYIEGVNRREIVPGVSYEKINISTIGIPLELKLRVEFCKYIGMGGTCFANLNSKKNYIGGMLELYFGNFRLGE